MLTVIGRAEYYVLKSGKIKQDGYVNVIVGKKQKKNILENIVIEIVF